MKHYLGVDCGGTKTRFLIGDENGKITAEYTGGSGYYQQCGLDGLTELIKIGTDQVCQIAGIDRNDITCAFVGCAGYGDASADGPLIEAAISAGLDGIRCSIGNDCENALAGALLGRPGINVIAGTGAICFGKTPDGKTARAGGWHHHLGGDEGSAYWLGWNLLNEFERQSDGRDARTLLYTAVKTILEIENDDEMNSKVVDEWGLDKAKIAGLAPLCGFLYEQNDLYGKGFVNVAAMELADLAIAVFRRLEFPEPVLISSTGGVFNLGEKIITPFKEILEGHGMEYVHPALSPACGSVILAMQMDGLEIDQARVAQMDIYSRAAEESDRKKREEKQNQWLKGIQERQHARSSLDQSMHQSSAMHA